MQISTAEQIIITKLFSKVSTMCHFTFYPFVMQNKNTPANMYPIVVVLFES
jgi:hypothetical protein